ncbi:MAG: alpha/beta fold hydrolase [Oligoflexales bacterium]|nr:alpha/beta fold hydrolase [Oligoflexales bacterium]
MIYDHHNKQLRFLLMALSVVAFFALSLFALFWGNLCDDSFSSCLAQKNLSPVEFLTLSFFRPFFFTPISVISVMAGNSFGPWLGTLYTALGGLATCFLVFSFGKLGGKRYVKPWLYANLPQTYRFVKRHDWKVVLAMRFIPIFPYDFCSLVFGLLDFRWRPALVLSLLASLPELYFFSKMGDPSETWANSSLQTLFWLSFAMLSPGIISEFLSRKEGKSMWVQLKAMWRELIFEIRLHNLVLRDRRHDPKKTPVLLLYGFFSSRRTLTYLELYLESKGYEVLNFNLGGLFGVFSTNSILEAAENVDVKLKRLLEIHQIKKIHIVAHSKGGLVAFWWLIKHQGQRHCDKLITLGTPFHGSYLSWLAILTPFGLLFRDVWDMRPGSTFLQQLQVVHLPRKLRLYNFYSKKDFVSRGEEGVYTPLHHKEQVIPVEVHDVGHEQFLRKKSVGEQIVKVLGSPEIND